MSEWVLRLTIERGVLPPNGQRPPQQQQGGLAEVSWTVRPSLALASDHNLAGLTQALQRDSVWDLFLFDGHSQGSVAEGFDTAKLRFLDPSMTPIELLLRDKAPVLVSASPVPHVANPRLLVPLRAATVRFAAWGPSLHVSNHRRVVRVTRDGWGGGVAICNFPLSNDSVNSVTFRISRAALGNEKSPSPQRQQPDHDDENNAGDLPAVGDDVPIAAIGLSDGSVEIDGPDSHVFGSHQRTWMVEPISGAIHNGGSTSKQTFLDAQLLRLSACMTFTLLLDTNKGTVFIVQNGRPVGGFNVTKILADSMYPTIELYSRGASVELV